MLRKYNFGSVSCCRCTGKLREHLLKKNELMRWSVSYQPVILRCCSSYLKDGMWKTTHSQKNTLKKKKEKKRKKGLQYPVHTESGYTVYLFDAFSLSYFNAYTYNTTRTHSWQSAHLASLFYFVCFAKHTHQLNSKMDTDLHKVKCGMTIETRLYHHDNFC